MRHLSIAFLATLALAMAGCGGTMPPSTDSTLGDADGGAAEGGLKPFGAACAGDSECDSHACFIGGNRTFCSLHCTTVTQATDCPVPPTSGACNMQGYCKP